MTVVTPIGVQCLSTNVALTHFDGDFVLLLFMNLLLVYSSLSVPYDVSFSESMVGYTDS